MRLEDSKGESLEQEAPLPAVAEQPAESIPPRRTHLVAVTTRAIAKEDQAHPGDTVRERYWNPHDHRWVEYDFESLEQLRHRHVEENGWELLQEQQLEGHLAIELIFKAHRIDFSRPSREQVLRDFGMTPEDVNHLLEHVDREQDRK